MTGLIWFVQIVHYPLFVLIPTEDFSHYHKQHVMRTGWVVVAPMLMEIVLAFSLFALTPSGVEKIVAFIGLLLLGVIWLSTFFSQVPSHNQLAISFSEESWKRLVQWNWVRTIGWTLRVPLASWMLIHTI